MTISPERAEWLVKANKVIDAVLMIQQTINGDWSDRALKAAYAAGLVLEDTHEVCWALVHQHRSYISVTRRRALCAFLAGVEIGARRG